MSSAHKILDQILSGRSDGNISFTRMCNLLIRLGFEERIRGSHHIFFRQGILEILNLQERNGKCKPYQVKQVRNVILEHQLAEAEDV